MASEPKMGTDGWIDLTVADAAEVRDFYSQVTECPRLRRQAVIFRSPEASASGSPKAMNHRAPIGRIGPRVSRCVEINVRMYGPTASALANPAFFAAAAVTSAGIVSCSA